MIRYTPTVDQIADIFTKPLPRPAFHKFKNMLTGYDPVTEKAHNSTADIGTNLHLIYCDSFDPLTETMLASIPVMLHEESKADIAHLNFFE